jgi:hypothetical protein
MRRESPAQELELQRDDALWARHDVRILGNSGARGRAAVRGLAVLPVEKSGLRHEPIVSQEQPPGTPGSFDAVV